MPNDDHEKALRVATFIFAVLSGLLVLVFSEFFELRWWEEAGAVIGIFGACLYLLWPEGD